MILWTSVSFSSPTKHPGYSSQPARISARADSSALSFVTDQAEQVSPFGNFIDFGI
jgi:hypothetical protein